MMTFLKFKETLQLKVHFDNNYHHGFLGINEFSLYQVELMGGGGGVFLEKIQICTKLSLFPSKTSELTTKGYFCMLQNRPIWVGK